MGGLLRTGGRLGLLWLLAALVACALPAVAWADLSWSGPLPLDKDQGQALRSVSCPSSTQCTALDGLGQETTFNPSSPGSAVTVAIDPSGMLGPVSCPSTHLCVTISFQGQEYRFDPTSAASTLTVADVPYTALGSGALTCPTTTECVATSTRDIGIGGPGGGYQEANAVTFKPASPDSDTVIDTGTKLPYNAIDCSVSQCTAVGPAGTEVTFDPTVPGSASSADVDSVSDATLTGVSCPASSECVAVDGSGNEINFDPAAPSDAAESTIDSDGGLTGLACSSASECVTVDGHGREVTFNPANPDVASPASIDPGQTPAALACPTAGQCTAVDSGGNEASFDPATPSPGAVSRIDGGTKLDTVACATATQCTAVDDSGREVTFDPSSPGSPAPVSIDPVLLKVAIGVSYHIACAATSQCTLVDDHGSEVTFNPGSPGTPSPVTVDGNAFLSGVACPSTSQCTAVDGNGREVTFNPATGGGAASATIAPEAELNGLACPTLDLCVAVGGVEEVSFDPSAPGAASSHNFGTPALTSVACPSTTQCTAVGDGLEITFNPANPALETTMAVSGPDGNPDNLVSVGCATTSICVASSPLLDNWAPVAPAANDLVEAVGCSPGAVCVAVDQAGNVFVGSQTALTSTAAVGPALLRAPAISGSAQLGRRLSASAGQWSGTAPLSFGYQWQRCGRRCTNIKRATSNFYRPTSADLGSRIRVTVSAANGAGSAAARSRLTAVVIPTVAQVKRALRGVMVPRGRLARIEKLVSHSGFTFRFRAPSAGKLVLSWSAGRHHIAVGSVRVVLHRFGKRVKVRLRLRGRGRGLLAGFARRRVAVKASFRAQGGRPVTLRRSLTLRA